jgi:hypothetical protein
LKLLTKQNIAQLRANAKAKKPIAYVKLFNPTGAGTWYLSELDENNIAYGVADVIEKELGYTSLDELSELKLPFGLTIERDLYFNPTPLEEVA